VPEGWHATDAASLVATLAQSPAAPRLALLVAGPAATPPPPELCALASHVFCLSPAEAEPVNAWLRRGHPQTRLSAIPLRSPAALLEALAAPGRQIVRAA